MMQLDTPTTVVKLKEQGKEQYRCRDAHEPNEKWECRECKIVFRAKRAHYFDEATASFYCFRCWSRSWHLILLS